jgi:hypothetical protein
LTVDVSQFPTPPVYPLFDPQRDKTRQNAATRDNERGKTRGKTRHCRALNFRVSRGLSSRLFARQWSEFETSRRRDLASKQVAVRLTLLEKRVKALEEARPEA